MESYARRSRDHTDVGAARRHLVDGRWLSTIARRRDRLRYATRSWLHPSRAAWDPDRAAPRNHRSRARRRGGARQRHHADGRRWAPSIRECQRHRHECGSGGTDLNRRGFLHHTRRPDAGRPRVHPSGHTPDPRGVVSESFARQVCWNSSPIGRQVWMDRLVRHRRRRADYIAIRWRSAPAPKIFLPLHGKRRRDVRRCGSWSAHRATRRPWSSQFADRFATRAGPQCEQPSRCDRFGTVQGRKIWPSPPRSSRSSSSGCC